MRYTPVPNHRRPIPQGISMMRPSYVPAQAGDPITIEAGTRGADLLEDIRLELSFFRPKMQRCIQVFAERKFTTAIHTSVLLVPHEKNFYVSLNTTLTQLSCKNLEPARLEHVLAHRRQYYRTGSTWRLIPALGMLWREKRSDWVNFPVLDERYNTLRFDSLCYTAISTDLSAYFIAAVPVAE